MHIANLDPDRPGYQVWEVHEEKEAWQTYGYEMHDARTGEIFGEVLQKETTDVD